MLWRKKLNTTAHTMWGVSGRLILVLLNNRQLPWLLLVQYESTRESETRYLFVTSNISSSIRFSFSRSLLLASLFKPFVYMGLTFTLASGNIWCWGVPRGGGRCIWSCGFWGGKMTNKTVRNTSELKRKE